jgi:hypothetical protein
MDSSLQRTNYSVVEVCNFAKNKAGNYNGMDLFTPFIAVGGLNMNSV